VLASFGDNGYAAFSGGFPHPLTLTTTAFKGTSSNLEWILAAGDRKPDPAQVRGARSQVDSARRRGRCSPDRMGALALRSLGGPAATRRSNNHPPPKFLHLKDLYLFPITRARTTPIDFLP
jgi:hypothetical protein